MVFLLGGRNYHILLFEFLRSSFLSLLSDTRMVMFFSLLLVRESFWFYYGNRSHCMVLMTKSKLLITDISHREPQQEFT